MWLDETNRKQQAAASEAARPLAGLQFDGLLVLLSLWTLVGAYYDAWAHIHVSELDSFFTPYHGVLYSGFLAQAVALSAAAVLNRRRGYGWRQAAPVGYGLSLLGVLLFAAGGVGDLIWHTLFGIESGVEPLLSPTHLMLALGSGLIVTGPLRSAWRRSAAGAQPAGWVAQLPALLSLALLLSVFTYFTQYAHPWARPYAAAALRPSTLELSLIRQALGVASILLQTGILMGLVLLAVRSWRIPPGGLTLILTINAAAMALMRDQHQILLPAIVAGVGADLLLRLLDPSPERPTQLRLFAFAVPAVLYALYFLALLLTGGLWWSIHLWAGSIALAGVVGWLLSYLVAPPWPRAG